MSAPSLTDVQVGDCVTAIKPYPLDLVCVPAEQLIAFARQVEKALAAPVAQREPSLTDEQKALRAVHAWARGSVRTNSRDLDDWRDDMHEIIRRAERALTDDREAVQRAIDEAAPILQTKPEAWGGVVTGDLLDFTASPTPVAQPEPRVPEGYKLVPLEPTEAMHAAAVRTIIRCTGNDDFPPRVYRAMLAAAPSQPESIGDAS